MTDWKTLLQHEVKKPYFRELRDFLNQERAEGTVYPPSSRIFEAYHLTPYDQVKVVILGQDPYHGPGQAHGLSFSVLPGVRVPPSLKNIYTELEDDLGCKPPKHGYLKHWAEQGVFMLNTILTVRASKPGSHKGKGWEKFTAHTLQLLSAKGGVVFILWGRAAKSLSWLINTEKNEIIQSPHPSPYSASEGFFGSRPFSEANIYLKNFGHSEIDWQLPETCEEK